MTESVVQRRVSEAARPTTRDIGGWPLRSGDFRQIATVAALMFAVTVAVGLFITRLLADSPLIAADADVNRWFAGLRTPTWNRLTDWGSALSDTITIVVLLLILVPALRFATGRWNASALLFGAVGLETLVFVTASLIVGRERPPVEQLDMSPPTASFPSGHTGAAFAFYIGLVVLVYWFTKNRRLRFTGALIFGSIPLAVAGSRLYRGMHFPSDVMWGAMIGITAVILFARLLNPNHERASHGVA